MRFVGKSVPLWLDDERVYRFIDRQTQILCGLGLVGLSFFLLFALATWSATDPSLSLASGGETQNLLGRSGAIAADLLIQLYGLASVLFPLPLIIWGWRMTVNHPNVTSRGRFIGWLSAGLCAAAGATIFPLSESWPLPSGAGGALGDTLLFAALVFVPNDVDWLIAVVLQLALLALSLVFLFYSCGLIGKWPQDTASFDRNLESPVYDDQDDAYYDLDTRRDRLAPFQATESRSAVFVGLIYHWIFSLVSVVRRYVRSLGSNTYGRDGERNDHAPAMDSNWFQKSAPEAEIRSAAGANHYDDQYQSGPLTDAAFAPYRDESGQNVSYDEFYNHGDGHYANVQAPFDSAAGRPVGIAGPMAPPVAAVSPRQMPPARGSRRVIRDMQSGFMQNGQFALPDKRFLQEPQKGASSAALSPQALEENARILEGVLGDFGVRGEIVNVRPGPVVTLYELEPAPGIKSSRVIGLADDIARSMSAISARVAVIPGKNAIGIELPNENRNTVFLRELISSPSFDSSKARLALSLGHNIGGDAVIADLARMPHLLVAGTTGSGKSVAINTMILSLVYRLTPEECRMIMIDPKMLELSIYDGIPHLLSPVVTDPHKAVVALKWTVREMEERYRKMSKLGVRNIDGFNARVKETRRRGEVMMRSVQTGFDRETGEAIFEEEELDLTPMPYIVVVVDEMADLMMVAGKDIEGAIQRLAQMARAAGIHLIMATQRPSVDVITGTIKANFPTRISFQVTSKIDSRTILGEQGAEQLLGQGDMLYMAGGGRIQRVHGPFVSDEEVEAIVNHLKAQGVPDYLDQITEDVEGDTDSAGASGGAAGGLSESTDLYDQAVAIVLNDRKASTSYIQRRLAIGYNRAATLIERMENEGVISVANHAGKREILVPEADVGMM